MKNMVCVLSLVSPKVRILLADDRYQRLRCPLLSQPPSIQHSGGNARYQLPLSTTSTRCSIPSDIYGQGRNTQKSSGYAPHPYFPTVFNTHNCIDKEMHGRKRRIVSQGFSVSAITDSEPMIIQHVDNFCNALLKAADESDVDDGWSTPQDMAAWSE